jgi:uncharacterized protein (DUF1501 family)
MSLSRRFFLRSGAVAFATVGSLPMWGLGFLRQTVFGADAPRAAGGKKILICVFQRGAADGLSMVSPFGDRDYYKLRQEIAIAEPARAAGSTGSLDLDGFFGLHPALSPLLPIYKSGKLAAIHACGSPNSTRSHFDAQDFMESGVTGDKSVANGWLNRALLACPEDRAKRATPFRAVALTPTLPRSMQGDLDALAIPNLATFGVGAAAGIVPTRNAMGAGSASASAAAGFESMYSSAVDQVLHGTARETFEAMAMLKKADPARYQPANGAKYGADVFSRSLSQIAQLIKADIGLEIAFAEIGGWDTHANQGAANGQLAGRLMDFSRGIAALYQDLGDRMNDVVILTMSEFGRAVRQNGNRGTDHGHATCFFALGGPVQGGKVLGRWPGLANEQLFEGRDLAVTTDYRDVFAEIARKHLGALDLSKVFPGYKLDLKNERGILTT